MSNVLETALSPSVRCLLLDVGVTDIPANINRFIAEELILNMKDIADILPEPMDTSEYFIQCTKQLAPAFKQAETLLDNMDSDTYTKKYSAYNAAIGCDKVCRDVHTLLISTDDSDHLLGMLLITAEIEKTLGDVYHTVSNGRQCPSLLKDILTSPELEQSLQPTTIQILRCVMGPPISLNIRNVIWHGFPNPGEIPKRYGYFLLILTSSLSADLQSRSFGNIQHRVRVSFPCEEYTEFLKDIHFEGPSVMKLLENSRIFGSRYPTIERAVTYYCGARYGFSAVLLLTQLEHAMRRAFSLVNNCQERIMTAEATTLYTTFDEILQPTMPSGEENKLLAALGESYMDMVHDLLVYPEGPRVRDRLGHGEADIHTFPETLSKAVLLTLCIFAVKQYNILTTDLDPELLKSLEAYEQTYESIFHPISIVKRNVKCLCYSLSKCKGMVKFSPDLNTGVDIDIYFMDDKIKEVFLLTSEVVNNLFDVIISKWNPGCEIPYAVLQTGLFSLLSSSDFMIQHLLKKRLHTLYKFKKSNGITVNSSFRESEIIVAIQHIIDEAKVVLEQTTQTLVARQQLLVSKQLRSRQRENLQRLINSFPFLHQALVFMAFVATWQIFDLKSSAVNVPLLLKFLKSSLQLMENLRTLTHPEKNKWKEAIDLWSIFMNKAKISVPNIFCTVPFQVYPS